MPSNVYKMPVECLLSVGTLQALHKHSASTQQTHSVDNTRWTLAKDSVGLVVYIR